MILQKVCVPYCWSTIMRRLQEHTDCYHKVQSEEKRKARLDFAKTSKTSALEDHSLFLKA